MTTLQLAGYVAQLLLWAGEQGLKLLKEPPPPSIDDLVSATEASLIQRHDEWAAQIKLDAAAERERAAQDAFKG